MNNKNNSMVKLCRAGVIGALYVILTITFGSLAFGPLQIRPAEALCLLPLFFSESIPGLFVGCMLANLFSGFGIADILLGGMATLAGAIFTRLVGKAFGGKPLGIILGGIPPVILNAVIIPFVIILATPDGNLAVYWTYFFQLLLTQTIWVYALGTPLVFGVGRARSCGVRYLL